MMGNSTLDQVDDGDLKNFTVALHYQQAVADILQDIEVTCYLKYKLSLIAMQKLKQCHKQILQSL